MSVSHHLLYDERVDLPAVVNLGELETLAQQALPEQVWAYVAGGAGNERTLAANSAAWDEILLSPKNLVDVSALDASISLFGITQRHPILLAPTATHEQYWPAGELDTIAGAHAAGTTWTCSTLSSFTVEHIGQAAHAVGEPWWMQAYLQTDRSFSRDLLDRAVAAGASAIMLTVDTASLGARDRDRRSNLGSPLGVNYPNLKSLPVEPDDTPAHQRLYNPHLAADATWADLEWLVDVLDVPVIVKGVLRPDQARLAIDHGAAAIVVSNHGARNLDTVPATAVALPRVVESVAGQVPVLVDGGIRRGTDIAKAIALGAEAVLIGRPYIWGLATAGAAGVTHAVEMLETELLMAMALLGTPTLASLTPDAIWA